MWRGYSWGQIGGPQDRLSFVFIGLAGRFGSRPLRHWLFCWCPLKATEEPKCLKTQIMRSSDVPHCLRTARHAWGLLALGSYPEVSLKGARVKRDAARTDLAHGVDPAVKRKCEEASAAEVVERTISPRRERRARRREPISAETIDTMNRRLEMHVFPYIGACRVGAITAPGLLEILRRIESRGTFELAHRVRSICSRVLRYAKATGRDCEDVGADLIGLLTPVESENMAAIVDPHWHWRSAARNRGLSRRAAYATCSTIGTLQLSAADRVSDHGVVANQPQRTDTRMARAVGRMKMRDPHTVPLSRPSQFFAKSTSIQDADSMCFRSYASPTGQCRRTASRPPSGRWDMAGPR